MMKAKTFIKNRVLNMRSLDVMLEQFTEKEGFECFGELNDVSIHEMENKLGVSFPEPYKVFLRKYGYVEWFGHTIYGYSEDEDYLTVERTLELREDEIPSDFERIPQNGCVLENYAGGGYYFLFSNESERSGEVALFIDELFGKEAQSWATFEAFLEYMLSL
ncbi:TPA: SMI1/KNR4 family protein [Vibrio parahaemolyticus]|uniref:SMI1/KNR4 family protein n=1 Tax=Vibrio parahaemolyticus TaxID=670 RepID=UPI0004A29EC8|nr:SMI1/KNR4 family protein [Vibrio parahaemolyticus]EJG2230203.1 SMI1/KNR4 family protein [Vibrio parahaemolyticus]ELJ9745211.1 SMI1/KNR4 family protein [Vibrio parahaemolyticus]HAV1326656.1 SMI1/KNR4 family protein [Vibrio parahaemolyticus]HBN6270656.1 SMI1/KNR4 family protein [Vibrio parahaemolyticus]HCG9703004.1 SMI1/KNR4 family protein [Vibrio parahaemolyticus]